MKIKWVVRTLLVLIFISTLMLIARADDDGGGKQGPQGAPGQAGAQGANGASAPATHLYGGLELNLGLYNARSFGVGLFNTFYAAPRDWGNVAGVSLSFNVGHDYEAERVDKLEKLIAELRGKSK